MSADIALHSEHYYVTGRVVDDPQIQPRPYAEVSIRGADAKAMIFVNNAQDLHDMAEEMRRLAVSLEWMIKLRDEAEQRRREVEERT